MPPRAVTAGRLTSGTRGAPARRCYSRAGQPRRGPRQPRVARLARRPSGTRAAPARCRYSRGRATALGPAPTIVSPPPATCKPTSPWRSPLPPGKSSSTTATRPTAASPSGPSPPRQPFTQRRRAGARASQHAAPRIYSGAAHKRDARRPPARRRYSRGRPPARRRYSRGRPGALESAPATQCGRGVPSDQWATTTMKVVTRASGSFDAIIGEPGKFAPQLFAVSPAA